MPASGQTRHIPLLQRITSIASLILAVLLVAFPAASDAAARKGRAAERSEQLVNLPGHVLPALEKATVLPPDVSAGKARDVLTLTLVLKRHDQAGFERYLRDVNDPASPTYRRFLGQSEIAARFGPSRSAYNKVLDHLRKHGFELVEGSANRLTLMVRGTRVQAERTLGLRISDYQIGDRIFYANDRDPALPKALSSHVMTISGLTNLARAGRSTESQWKRVCSWQPSFPHDSSLPVGYSASSVTEFAFGKPPFPGLLQTLVVFVLDIDIQLSCLVRDVIDNLQNSPYDHLAGILDGTGQTIGLLEFDTFRASDISDYIGLINRARGTIAPISKLSQVPVNGGVSTPGSGQVEVLLDIAATMRIAPGARVVVYHAPFSGQAASYATLFNAMINDGVTVISNSWSSCEDQVTLADVQGIDAVLQSAAASGISVFNASGDSGNTCLDGSPNTAGVPATSPSATAVGGTSLRVAPGSTYGSETWWDGSNSTPPTGRGGFGVSRYFARPAYQDGLNASSMRSIPDVVVAADPANGITLCQADDGGCPTGLAHGGNKLSGADLGSFHGTAQSEPRTNIGPLTSVLYPLANTDAFHNASSMGSDFAHVGLGSPNLNVLNRLLSGGSVGLPDPVQSQVSSHLLVDLDVISAHHDASGVLQGVGVPADGSSKNGVLVRLLDANGNIVSGRTVTLTPNGGNAVVTPASAVTSVSNGAAVFEVTDLTPEMVTFTVTDTTDGIVLQNTASVIFGVPPAISAGISANPPNVQANGTSTAVITVTLRDSLG